MAYSRRDYRSRLCIGVVIGDGNCRLRSSRPSVFPHEISEHVRFLQIQFNDRHGIDPQRGTALPPHSEIDPVSGRPGEVEREFLIFVLLAKVRWRQNPDGKRAVDESLGIHIQLRHRFRPFGGVSLEPEQNPVYTGRNVLPVEPAAGIKTFRMNPSTRNYRSAIGRIFIGNDRKLRVVLPVLS